MAKPRGKPAAARKRKTEAPDESYMLLAKGALFPLGTSAVAIGYAFHKGSDGKVRLAMSIAPNTSMSREAWGAVWTILRADFKTWSEMGKRRKRRARYRRLHRRHSRNLGHYVVSTGGVAKGRKKKPAPKPAPSPAVPSGDLVAVAATKLKQEGREPDETENERSGQA